MKNGCAPNANEKNTKPSTKPAPPSDMSDKSAPRPAVDAKQLARIHDDYTNEAHDVIVSLKDKSNNEFENFTTTKLRNIFAMVSDIYNDVILDTTDVIAKPLQTKLQYLKIRLVYECGRNPETTRVFVEKAGLLYLLDEIKGDRQAFIEFANYMEALVAYFRYEYGRE